MRSFVKKKTHTVVSKTNSSKEPLPSRQYSAQVVPRRARSKDHMLKNWAIRSANAATMRSASDAEYAKKRIAKETADRQALERRRARVQAAKKVLQKESTSSSILRHAHQYGAAVSKMNKAKLMQSNKFRKVNRYPNPVPKHDQLKKKNRHARSAGHLGASKSRERNGRTGGDSAVSNIQKEVERIERIKEMKKARAQGANNGWGMMSKYAAAKLQAEKQAQHQRNTFSKMEMKAYLDQQVARKQKIFTDMAEEKVFWRKKNMEDTKKWREEEKSNKAKLLAKNLEIKQARQVQLAHLEKRRREQARILKQEDDRMMARQKREKQRVARERRAKIIAQQEGLDRVKEENIIFQEKKREQQRKQWEEDARLDAQWKEILDKQERERQLRLEDLYRKQQGLVKIGLQAAKSNADLLAADAARAKRHQDELTRKEDERAAARKNKAERMKAEMLKSLNDAVKFKEDLQRKQALADAEFARRFISENNRELNKADDNEEKSKK